MGASHTFSLTYSEVFGKEVLPASPEIDRAHRSLTPKPSNGRPPHPVSLRLHRYQTKDLIIREARRRGRLDYRGISIHVVEDYSPEVLSQCAEYKDVMSDLYKCGFMPSLLFPARLRITLPNGTRKFMGSVEATRQYIKNLLKSPGST